MIVPKVDKKPKPSYDDKKDDKKPATTIGKPDNA